MKRMIVAALFSALTGTALLAQGVTMKANIPFDFQIGGTALPAGQYIVQDRTTYLLVRQTEHGNKTVMVQARPGEREGANANAHLTFHRYGNSYFLHQVCIGSYENARDLPQTKAEKSAAKELARNQGNSSEVVALLGAK
jgi:hypothetical protein